MSHRDDRGLVFAALDGKLIDADVWEAVRARIDERANSLPAARDA